MGPVCEPHPERQTLTRNHRSNRTEPSHRALPHGRQTGRNAPGRQAETSSRMRWLMTVVTPSPRIVTP